jgi:hypothetical protein
VVLQTTPCQTVDANRERLGPTNNGSTPGPGPTLLGPAFQKGTTPKGPGKTDVPEPPRLADEVPVHSRNCHGVGREPSMYLV